MTAAGRGPVAAHGWLAAVAVLGAGAAVYWVSSRPAVFESWFALPRPEALGLDAPALVAGADAVRRWLPDLCWAFFAGVATRDILWALAGRAFWPVIVLGAASWELGQALGVLPGGYTHLDLFVSLAGGLAAYAWPGPPVQQEAQP